MWLDAEKLSYLVDGAALLGSGGGGSLSTGHTFVDLILKCTNGNGLALLTPPELNTDSSQTAGCVLCDIGAITAIETDQQAAIANAFDALNAYQHAQGKAPITVLMPIETGPENSLVPLVLAAQRGLAVLDADGAGRAVPSLPLCTLADLPACPAFIANQQNDFLIVQTSQTSSLDDLLRPITASPQFGNSASLALWSASVADLWERSVPGALSQAVWCGQLVAGLRNHDVALVAEALPFVNRRRGIVLGQGTVQSVDQNESGAFNFGTIRINSERDKSQLTILTQNENLILFSNTQSAPLLAAPHTISYLKTDLNPLTNSEIKAGDTVYVLGIEADARLISPAFEAGFQALLQPLGFGGQLPPLPDSVQPLGTVLQGLQIA